jgi:F0F1-type ATP synthase delta subunit
MKDEVSKKRKLLIYQELFPNKIKIITSAENCEKIIKKILRKKDMLKCQVHKKIIGGFLLYVETLCWDASVMGQIYQFNKTIY